MRRLHWLCQLLTITALSLLPISGLAQSITVPATVTIPVPGLVVIRPTAIDAQDVAWYSITPGLQTFPSDVVTPKLGVFLGLAMQPGTYQLGVIAAKDVGAKAALSVPQIVTVQVGPPGPIPPGPIPPGPTDPLGEAIQAGWLAETDPAKLGLATNLAATYRDGVGIVNDMSKSTWSDVFKAVEMRAVARGCNGKLLGVQKAVQAEALKVLPNSTNFGATITQAERTTAGSIFDRASNIVGGLK